MCQTRPIKCKSKTFAYWIMKKIWIEKIAKLLSHSIFDMAFGGGHVEMYGKFLYFQISVFIMQLVTVSTTQSRHLQQGLADSDKVPHVCHFLPRRNPTSSVTFLCPGLVETRGPMVL